MAQDIEIIKQPIFELENTPNSNLLAYHEGFINGLTLKRQNKKQRRLVPKTPLESKFKKKYMELLSRPQNEEEFNKMVEDFKNDVEKVKITNTIYQ